MVAKAFSIMLLTVILTVAVAFFVAFMIDMLVRLIRLFAKEKPETQNPDAETALAVAVAMRELRK